MKERRFDMTDFEDSLKEQADKFVIFPSPKSWRGIYNNLHPGSKWPSLGIGMAFLITLVWIGFSSKNTHKDTLRNSVQQEQVSQENTQETASTPTSVSNNNNIKVSVPGFKLPSQVNQASRNLNVLENKNIGGDIRIPSFTLAQELITSSPDRKSEVSINEIVSEASQASINEIISLPVAHISLPEMSKKIILEQSGQVPSAIDVANIRKFISMPDGKESKNLQKELEVISSSIKISSKISSKIEDQGIQAQTIKKLKGKRNGKISWEYFVTPVISSVYFKGDNLAELSSGNQPSVVVNPAQSTHAMITNARVGFELGSDMKYTISKRFKLITGVHLSYEGYNILSNYVHPSFTSLTLKDSRGRVFDKKYVAFYGNGQGESHVNLHNYNVQMGIPVGVQVVLWNNEDVSIDFASSFEPFVVLGSKAYVLSSNGRNYIDDPDLTRRINVSGNFEPIITFSARDLKWHIGPSIRYQILSTYRNIYPVQEHLLHYGIRVGISGK